MSFIESLHFNFDCRKCSCKQGPCVCCSTVNYGTWQSRVVLYDQADNQLYDGKAATTKERLIQRISKDQAELARARNMQSFDAIEFRILQDYHCEILEVAESSGIDLTPFESGKSCMRMRDYLILKEHASKMKPPADTLASDAMGFLLLKRYQVTLAEAAKRSGISVDSYCAGKQAIMLIEYQKIKRAAQQIHEERKSEPLDLSIAMASSHTTRAYSAGTAYLQVETKAPEENFSQPKFPRKKGSPRSSPPAYKECTV